jgi:ankyrin repeat protein
MPVDVCERHHRSALHLAAAKGDSHMCDLFLQLGADIEAADDWERTPLHWAALAGSSSTCAMLLHMRGTNVPGAGGARGARGARGAGGAGVARARSNNTMNMNMNIAASHSARDTQQRTPLHLAATKGNRGVCRLLVAGGAEVNARDNQQVYRYT